VEVKRLRKKIQWGLIEVLIERELDRCRRAHRPLTIDWSAVRESYREGTA
jgi:hypothetical protein